MWVVFFSSIYKFGRIGSWYHILELECIHYDLKHRQKHQLEPMEQTDIYGKLSKLCKLVG